MSNQFSMILSMLMLTFIIMFSVEVINYEKQSSLVMGITNNVAYRFQHYGYDMQDAHNMANYYAKEVSDIDIIYDDITKEVVIKTIKYYESIFKPFSFMNGYIKCDLIVYL